jgi:hypothetical protein
MGDLPQAQNFSTRLEVSLLPTSPHFDFGFGLSPFAHLTLPDYSDGAVLFAFADSPGTGLLVGGEMTIRYVEPQVTFLSAIGEVVAAAEDTGLSVRVFEGRYRLGRIVRIPAAAKSVIVASVADSTGKIKTTTSFSLPGTFVIGGLPIATPSVQHSSRYTAHTYGPLLVAIGTSQK